MSEPLVGEQALALEAITAWLEDDDPANQVFRLFGPAGTGKTTIAVRLHETVKYGGVLYAAPTGKAANVMQRKGAHGAQTIHKLIYTPKNKSQLRLKTLQDELAVHEIQYPLDQKKIAETQTEITRELDNLKRPSFTLNLNSQLAFAKVAVLDEMSMIDNFLGADITSFGTKILALGDPFQLPPVKGSGFFMTDRPEFMLKEIHRQAKESPILRLATIVREEQRRPNLGRMPGCKVITADQVDKSETLASDQILVGRNATRHRMNAQYRKRLGYTDPYPTKGERLVCLRNNNTLQIYNGSQWFVQRDPDPPVDDMLILDLINEDGDIEVQVVAHAHHFDGRSDELKWPLTLEAEEFAYGYVLTVHKSQGSQWDKVTLIDESSAFRGDWARWLYTGITRTAKDLTVIV